MCDWIPGMSDSEPFVVATPVHNCAMRVQSAQFGGDGCEGQDCGQWLRRSACLSCLVTVSPGASSHLRVFVSSCCRALQGEEGNRRCGIVMDMIMFIVSSLGLDRPNSSLQGLRVVQGRAGPGDYAAARTSHFRERRIGDARSTAQWTCVCMINSNRGTPQCFVGGWQDI